VSDRDRQQIRLLAAALGLPSTSGPTPISEEVLRLARDGDRMAAIRLVKRETGIGLLSAKRLVDEAARLP
jgi:ribosomal protein L7/L12